jgi:hypothetical protein
VLIGGGELAEIATLAAMEADVVLVAIIDGATNQHRIAGIEVVGTLDAAPDFDGVVITDGNAPQETYDAVRAALPQARILCPDVLQVATERPMTKPRKTRAVG